MTAELVIEIEIIDDSKVLYTDWVNNLYVGVDFLIDGKKEECLSCIGRLEV
jgi:hypothetical protein